MKAYLLAEAAAHPSAQPRDLLKLCYQAAFGAEHLLADPAAARRLFDAEWAATPPREGALWQPISERYARAHLAACKHHALPPGPLFDSFLRTASHPAPDGEALFQKALKDTEALATAGALPFDLPAWQACVQAHQDAGGGPVHHSDIYRAQEHPAYRVVLRTLLTTIR